MNRTQEFRTCRNEIFLVINHGTRSITNPDSTLLDNQTKINISILCEYSYNWLNYYCYVLNVKRIVYCIKKGTKFPPVFNKYKWSSIEYIDHVREELFNVICYYDKIETIKDFKKIHRLINSIVLQRKLIVNYLSDRKHSWFDTNVVINIQKAFNALLLCFKCETNYSYSIQAYSSRF